MIVYGYKNKEVEGGTGIFTCPHCNEQRVFKHVKVVRYFTLFFIQLFPLGKVSEYIQCQICHRNYPMNMIATHGVANSEGKTYQPIPAEKSTSCLPSALTMGGALTSGLGCLAGVVLILFQIDNPNNWEGFFGLVALCPAPLTTFGLISLLIGLHVKRKEEIDLLHK